MQSGDGGLGFIVAGHVDKAEPTGTAGVTIGGDEDLVHGAVGGEEFHQVAFSGRKRTIADKNSHAMLLVSPKREFPFWN